MDQVINISNLSVVIPVYNSEKSITLLVENTISTLKQSFKKIEIIIVNDGSTDNSHAQALLAVKQYPGIVKYIRLAQNYGEHNAVMCGLHYVTGDCVAIIDDDFQNPPSEILSLVEKLRDGFDVVYSYYLRKQHHWLRNLGSALNDRFATWLLKKPKGLYLSSFKVINASLVRIIIQYQGPYPYIDGIILRSTSRIGSRLCNHEKRKTGQSNYTLMKMIHLWLNMVTGFSIIPLRVVSLFGLSVSFFTIIMTVFYVISWKLGGVFLKQHITPGWASTIVSITFFAGLQLCVLGLIGEYLGRLLITINRSPQFIVRDIYDENKVSK